MKELRDFLHMRMTVLAVPEDIADYLSGVGEVSDYARVPRTLSIGVMLDDTLINGLSGHYGRVDAATHIHYETIPFPFVALAAIVHEYAYSVAPRSNFRFLCDQRWKRECNHSRTTICWDGPHPHG